jgi:hypothetical protein
VCSVIAYAVVIATPPIWAPSSEGPFTQPPAIVVGIVIGAIHPDPDTIPENPMPSTVVKVVIAIVVALSEATIAVAMVAVAMVAVAIEGLGIATTDITLRTCAD